MNDVSRSMTRQDWIEVLRRLGIRPSRALGQNFLVEPSVVERIVDVAELRPGEPIIEIGPGLGTLTRELLRNGDRVIAIELDRELASHIRAEFGASSPLTLVESDALRVDIDSLVAPDESYSVAANLPYASASAIIRFFLEAPHPPRRMTVMVQREVGERLAAEPPAMSILGVATQLHATATVAFHVPPGAFVPSPKVESSVVRLDVRPTPLLEKQLQLRFFQLVNAGFRHKRKTIANSIADETRLPKSFVAEQLIAVGIEPLRRAQTLSLAEWIALTRAWPEAAA